MRQDDPTCRILMIGVLEGSCRLSRQSHDKVDHQNRTGVHHLVSPTPETRSPSNTQTNLPRLTEPCFGIVQAAPWILLHQTMQIERAASRRSYHPAGVQQGDILLLRYGRRETRFDGERRNSLVVGPPLCMRHVSTLNAGAATTGLLCPEALAPADGYAAGGEGAPRGCTGRAVYMV